MSEEKTTVQISISLDNRIKKLAELRSQKLGLSQPVSKRAYLELIVTEEEERLSHETDQV